jgi:hypothetical protein
MPREGVKGGQCWTRERKEEEMVGKGRGRDERSLLCLRVRASVPIITLQVQ